MMTILLDICQLRRSPKFYKIKLKALIHLEPLSCCTLMACNANNLHEAQSVLDIKINSRTAA